MVAFAVDMFVIAIAYQGTHNQAPKLPEWFVVGIALFIGLWTDAIVFNLLSAQSLQAFTTNLPGDVIGKTLSAAILWIPTSYYVVRIAPALPDHIDNANRPIFDILIGSFKHIKMALVRSEAALEESETKRRQEAIYFRQISENISEALWLTSGDESKILYVNSRYERIWGRSAATLYASSEAFLESIHPEDRERVRMNLPRQNATDKTLEYRIIRPDGSIRWLRDRAFPVLGKDGKMAEIAGVTEDITEQHLLEEQQVALKVSQEKVKYLREFIAEATHDLKTPLTSINFKIFRLAKITDEDGRRRLTTELTGLTNHLGKMIEDILTLSRLDSAVKLSPVSFDLNDTIQKHCSLLLPSIEEKSLNLILDLSNSTLRLQADPEDLSRAMGNLIENAIHYTPNNGTVTIGTQIVDKALIFTISDTGIGIPLNEQPHVFERFYRAANARHTDIGGTGLGLAIVKKIVEQHRGRLEFTSTEDQGTTFSVYLPLM